MRNLAVQPSAKHTAVHDATKMIFVCGTRHAGMIVVYKKLTTYYVRNLT